MLLCLCYQFPVNCNIRQSAAPSSRVQSESYKFTAMWETAEILRQHQGHSKLKIKIYRTIILPVVLYGCETWSLTLREERRLRVFENRVLRRVFGPRREEVTGE